MQQIIIERESVIQKWIQTMKMDKKEFIPMNIPDALITTDSLQSLHDILINSSHINLNDGDLDNPVFNPLDFYTMGNHSCKDATIVTHPLPYLAGSPNITFYFLQLPWWWYGPKSIHFVSQYVRLDYLNLLANDTEQKFPPFLVDLANGIVKYDFTSKYNIDGSIIYDFHNYYNSLRGKSGKSEIDFCHHVVKDVLYGHGLEWNMTPIQDLVKFIRYDSERAILDIFYMIPVTEMDSFVSYIDDPITYNFGEFGQNTNFHKTKKRKNFDVRESDDYDATFNFLFRGMKTLILKQNSSGERTKRDVQIYSEFVDRD